MKTISHLCFALSVSQGADIYKSKENIEKKNMLAKRCNKVSVSVSFCLLLDFHIGNILYLQLPKVPTSADINNNNAANIPQGFPVS